MADGDVIVLPLHCPKCDHDGALLRIRSTTVLTVNCADCTHSWSVDIGALPPEIEEQVMTVIVKIPL